jgi:hypothetical protein
MIIGMDLVGLLISMEMYTKVIGKRVSFMVMENLFG